jgi:hypothetical protein
VAKAQIIAGPAVPQTMVTREFAAPQELLFRADTDPDLLVQPLGPRDLTLAMDYCDPRHDGAWRYTSSDGRATNAHSAASSTADRLPMASSRPPSSKGMQGHVCPCLETVTLTQRADMTLLTQSTLRPPAIGPSPGGSLPGRQPHSAARVTIGLSSENDTRRHDAFVRQEPG